MDGGVSKEPRNSDASKNGFDMTIQHHDLAAGLMEYRRDGKLNGCHKLCTRGSEES